MNTIEFHKNTAPFEQFQCDICITPYSEGEQVTQLACLHLFHYNCLQGVARCPFDQYAIAGRVTVYSREDIVKLMDELDKEVRKQYRPIVYWVTKFINERVYHVSEQNVEGLFQRCSLQGAMANDPLIDLKNLINHATLTNQGNATIFDKSVNRFIASYSQWAKSSKMNALVTPTTLFRAEKLTHGLINWLFYAPKIRQFRLDVINAAQEDGRISIIYEKNLDKLVEEHREAYVKMGELSPVKRTVSRFWLVDSLPSSVVNRMKDLPGVASYRRVQRGILCVMGAAVVAAVFMVASVART